jgi:NAD(P)-dependent dehydrogenase (short-subunit alcohol dehydrogenase family)
MGPRRLFILTGASRGLGAAMAEQLLAPDVQLLTISRRPDNGLDNKAAAARATLEQWAVDLALPLAVAARLESWLKQRDATTFSGATLINNAAITGRPGPIDTSDAEDLSALLRIGLEAPLLLASAFCARPAAGKGCAGY